MSACADVRLRTTRLSLFSVSVWSANRCPPTWRGSLPVESRVRSFKDQCPNPVRATKDLPPDGTLPLSPRERIIASADVLLGAVVVIGHNVYRVFPNEVPILVVILWASLLIRRKPWSSVGLSRPFFWKLTVIVAICGGVLLQLKTSLQRRWRFSSGTSKRRHPVSSQAIITIVHWWR